MCVYIYYTYMFMHRYVLYATEHDCRSLSILCKANNKYQPKNKEEMHMYVLKDK